MTKKLIIISVISLAIFAVAGFAFFNHSVLAQESCPANTIPGETQATLVGEIMDDGGDPNLEVWFQYGKTSVYGYQTAHQSKYGTGLFCATVYNLEPCTTYYYRAVAKNSAGTSYGDSKSFTTTCSPVLVDIKANGSDGPVTLKYKDYVNLSWTSQNAVSCTASGDWVGSKSISGSQTIQLNQIKNYTFNITCSGQSGQTKTDSVTVKISANPPVVVTKPAIVTY